MRTAIELSLRESTLPRDVGDVIDMAPVGGSECEWLVLGDDGGLTVWSPDSGDATRVATTAVPPEPDHDPWTRDEPRRRLHASRNGRFAAVVNDYGTLGEVIDLRSGQVTLTLRDDDPDGARTVPFAFAFAEHRGQTIAIHRTAWNRLDVSDAATGRLLTPRAVPEPDGPHALDYFHGRLHVSPNNRRILDDGWLWHPFGIPAAWRLDDWLNFNVWESEDGATRVDLCERQSYWNHPMTWLTDARAVLWGLGDTADRMRAGVRIFDLTKAAPVEVAAFETGAYDARASALFAAGDRLHVASVRGLSSWRVPNGGPVGGEPVGGEQTSDAPGFEPAWLHPGARQLAARLDRTLVRCALSDLG